MNNVCPLCEGEKGWDELITPEWYEPAEYKHITCWECQGKGELSELQMAIYKAKHMSPPIRDIRFD
jgi:hypothetical protein